LLPPLKVCSAIGNNANVPSGNGYAFQQAVRRHMALGAGRGVDVEHKQACSVVLVGKQVCTVELLCSNAALVPGMLEHRLEPVLGKLEHKPVLEQRKLAPVHILVLVADKLEPVLRKQVPVQHSKLEPVQVLGMLEHKPEPVLGSTWVPEPGNKLALVQGSTLALQRNEL